MKIAGKVFVLTGGGSGIGRELVLALLAKGAKVAALDIRKEGLEETLALVPQELQQNVSLHVLDVTDRAKVQALPAKIIKQHGAVDGLINNAGIIQPFVPFNDLDYAAIEHVLNVNLWGQIHMLKAFLPELLKRPEAHVANVSSMGGFFPFPGQTLYGASKAAVKLLTEGLYAELVDTNVGVSIIFPGAINTNISANSGVDMGAAAAGSDGPSIPMTQPDAAANMILAAIEKNKFQAFVGTDSRVMNLLYRLRPKFAVGFIQKQMAKMLQ